MKKKHIDLIEQGIKRTTLRDLKYANYPFEKKTINVPEDLTSEIAIWEGYNNVGELIDELKRLRHKLPKKMFLYFLDKEIKDEKTKIN